MSLPVKKQTELDDEPSVMGTYVTVSTNTVWRMEFHIKSKQRKADLYLALFIPDVRPEIIPMLPAHLGEKTDMEKKITWCVSNLIFSATT